MESSEKSDADHSGEQRTKPMHFKTMFTDAYLEVEDLFLLENFQIGYLPGWIPNKEFAAVLNTRPEIKRYLIKQNPEIKNFIDQILEKFPVIPDANDLRLYEDRVIWTIADMLVYQKCPEVYDELEFHRWDFDEITSIVDLTDKTVIDAGSGTGRVALEAAESARTVFAVEPVERLRRFIKQKADKKGFRNLFVVDGFLNRLPFQERFADVVLTSHALGWSLLDELTEIERVVKRPGTIIHCPGTASGSSEDVHEILIGDWWKYRWAEYEEAGGRKRKYWKFLW